MRRFLTILLALALLGAAPPPLAFTSYARQFDRFEARTRTMPADRRAAAFRAMFDRLFPGLYADKEPARLNRRIAKALAEFPAIRAAYRQVEARFPVALRGATRRFRAIFADFVSPLPIYLVHELGVRDGGSDYVRGRKVMLFGADVIAKIHNDDSLEPFLIHELFHLEHARHFADCDQLWCPLWQEGLATYAVSAMTPGATDHQLLLDQPEPIRAATDRKWREALCRIAKDFDSADPAATDAAFTGGRNPPGLPARFGYYVGMRIAAEAARKRTLPTLARLDDAAARPIVAAALTRLLVEANAPCDAPAVKGTITHEAARPA